MNLTISQIQKDELSILMQEEAFKEGWSYSQQDVDFYYHCPQNCIYAVKVDGKLAGCVILYQSLSQFQDKPVFSAGFFLVLNEYRSKKIVGPYLWERAITSHIDDNAVVCFHSVPRAVNYYERLNFQKTGLIDRYMILEKSNLNQQALEAVTPLFAENRLRTIGEDQYGDIDEYNNQLFPGDAGLGLRNFVQQWIKRPDAVIIGYYYQNRLQGFGVITLCKQLPEKINYRISPIYAETTEIAQAIVTGLVKTIATSDFYHVELNTLAIPEGEFGSFLEEIGFTQGGMNFVVCNKPSLISTEASILKNIFCSIPLEYPHEVLARGTSELDDQLEHGRSAYPIGEIHLQ